MHTILLLQYILSIYQTQDASDLYSLNRCLTEATTSEASKYADILNVSQKKCVYVCFLVAG